MLALGPPETWSIGQRDTVIDALERAVAKHPDRILLDFGGEFFSYGDVDRLSTRLANALTTLGVGQGETVVTMLDNNVDAIISWLAINKSRAISVPINTALRGEFLRHQIVDAGAKLVICETDYLDRLRALIGHLPSVKTILYRGPIVGGEHSATVRIAPLDEFRSNDDAPLREKPLPSDLACLIYTAGTTGPSKGCMLSYNFMCNLARLQLRAGPAAESDITITPLPLFHMNAVCVGYSPTFWSAHAWQSCRDSRCRISGRKCNAQAPLSPQSWVAWARYCRRLLTTKQ